MVHDGLWRLSPGLSLVMVKDGQRTFSTDWGDRRTLQKSLKFEPYVEYEHDTNHKKLAPIEMLIWEG